MDGVLELLRELGQAYLVKVVVLDTDAFRVRGEAPQSLTGQLGNLLLLLSQTQLENLNGSDLELRLFRAQVGRLNSLQIHGLYHWCVGQVWGL
jgi:hypothetical protein